MCNISVHRYPVPTDSQRSVAAPGVNFVSDSWQGWIEPDDQSWIVFIDADGRPVMFLDRDPQTGAVL
jgi:hypothetical protein